MTRRLIVKVARHGHLKLDAVVRTRLLGVSAATIDRLLGAAREAAGHARRRRWGAGLDTDNDSAFMNETLQGYCDQYRIEWTRSRAYHNNDQAWVEQKNGAVVRRLAGYGRLSGLAAAGALQRLYESARLYVNFFQPSFKLASKQRDGAQVHKRYYPPLTPNQRLLASDAVDETVKQRLRERYAALDPVTLLKTIRDVQQELLALSNHESRPTVSSIKPEYFDAFATAWHNNYRAPKGPRKTVTRHWWRTRTDPCTVAAWQSTHAIASEASTGQGL